jgi:hypothetical protein
VLIHGASGSGKSSLVRAGVLPRLAGRYLRVGAPWRTFSIRPSGGPLWNLAKEFARLEGHADEDDITPANLEVWPSLTCTARCHSCPYIRNGARRAADRTLDHDFLMPIELWQILAAEFSAAGGLSVTFTGGGEPTVNKNLGRFALIARQYGLEWGLYTNGATLTPEIIDEMLEHEPTFIRVSINSESPAAHHALYRLGSEAYWYVQKMISHILRRARANTSSIGLGYIMTHAIAV